jgi:very-short-patch-repair endonuclease
MIWGKQFQPRPLPFKGRDRVRMGLMQGQTSKKILKRGLQRKLRKGDTDAEKVLWRALRNRRFCNLKFRRQHPFEQYSLDFACCELRLIIELDGGQHATQVQHDEARTRRLQRAGFTTIRFWNHEVLQQLEAVKEKILLTVQELQRQTHPHPCPPLEGEGVVPER